MDLNLIIGLLLSAAIGLSLGLIGGGGSIITVPVLVIAFTWRTFEFFLRKEKYILPVIKTTA